jgi:hypothetical protein
MAAASRARTGPAVPPQAAKVLEVFNRALAGGTPTALEAPEGQDTAVELEVRFPKVRAPQFANLVREMAKIGQKPTGPVRTTLNTHENQKGPSDRQTSVVQEREFVGLRKTAEAYRRKSQLAPPYQAYRFGTNLFRLAVAEEAAVSKEEAAIVVESRVIHRGKARISYRQVVPRADGTGHVWQIDLTVVRGCADKRLAVRAFQELAGFKVRTPEDFAKLAETLGEDASGARSREARADATKKGLADVVRLGTARHIVLTFEVEAEYVGPAPGPTPPPLTLSDVNQVAGAILRMMDPAFMAEASYQEQLRGVDAILRGTSRDDGRDASGRPLRLKTTLPQVKALDRRIYAGMYPDVVAGKYFVTPKADGDRALALLYSDRIAVLGPSLVVFPTRAALSGNASEEIRAVLDGEFIREGRSGGAEFWAFDALFRVPALSRTSASRGPGVAPTTDPIRSLPFSGRLGEIADLVPHYAALELETPVLVSAKTFVHLQGAPRELGESKEAAVVDAAGDARALLEQIDSVQAAKWPFGTDGLVLVRDGAGYAKTASYKLKPPDQKTIDVLARRPNLRNPEVGALVDRVLKGVVVGGAGEAKPKAPPAVYFLFSGMDTGLRQELGISLCPGYEEIFRGRPGRRGYAPVPLSPVADPYAYVWAAPAGSPDYNGKVLEMVVKGMAEAPGIRGIDSRLVLALTRVRDDRAKDVASGGYFGNDYRVATQVIMEALHPLRFEELATGPAGDYFASKKMATYRRATGFTSMVKSHRISRFSGATWVIDLAAGKGQDLNRYADARVQNLVAVDIDRAALAELASRYVEKNTKGRGKGRDRSSRTGAPMRVHTLQADLNSVNPTALNQTLLRLGVGGGTGMADGVVCNLAAHYFAATGKTVAAFARRCEVVCRPGGILVLTVMRGGAVHDLLKAEGVDSASGVRTWTAEEDGRVKYQIEKRYPDDTIQTAGQRIGVLLPFSDGELYEEFLLNEDAFIEALGVAGFDLKERKSFEEHLTQQAGESRKLSDVDKQYLSLYGELVFEKRLA